MIIISIVIFTVLAFIFFIYISNKGLAYTLTILATLGLIVSSYFAVINWKNHYGLEKYTITSTKQIYSVSPNKSMSMILYQPVGSKNNHQVYIYKKTADAKKTSHTQASSTTKNKVIKTSGETKIVTTTTRWRYSSGASKFWFGLTGENHKYVKRVNKIHVNKDWLVLTVNQSKTLQKQMKSKAYQAKLKSDGKAYVTKGMAAAMMKNPTMSKAQQAKLQKQLTAEFQKQAVGKLVQSVK